MKKTFLLISVTLFCATLFATGTKNNSNRAESIKAYFAESLSGNNAEYGQKKNIKLNSIAQERAFVWNLWKESVNSFNEEKLIPLGLLKEKNSGSWRLPESLEPNATMPFYWGVNSDSAAILEEESKLPMFLYMHGSGDKNREWETGLKLALGYFYSPAVYMVPQIPNGYGELYRWAIQSKQWAWEKLLRLAFVNDKIDANRIYFFGISEGGYGSQRLAAFYADYLAGAGPMAGGEPLKNAPMENVANIAFSLRTGELDYGFGRNMLTNEALKTATELKRQHPGYFNHFIEIIPQQGHSIDYRPTTPWLAKFERNPHPRYFYWENYDMYGRHRDCFYNIRVNETSAENDKQRTCYEFSCEENTINLTVKNVTYTATLTHANIEFLFSKEYSSVNKGNITIYLNEELFDLKKPITILLNGKKIFKGKVKPSLDTMVESCALYYDPERIFPAAIKVDIANQKAKDVTKK